MVKNGIRPIHPGEILLEEFLQPSDPPLNANTLAKALRVREIITAQNSRQDYGRIESI
jgi:plasmid maintenance system antidote protein VapI